MRVHKHMAPALRFLVLIVPVQKPCALSRWSRMTDHFALRAGTEFAPQRESARTHILRITISSFLTMRYHRRNPRYHRQASRGASPAFAWQHLEGSVTSTRLLLLFGSPSVIWRTENQCEDSPLLLQSMLFKNAYTTNLSTDTLCVSDESVMSGVASSRASSARDRLQQQLRTTSACASQEFGIFGITRAE